MCCTWFAHDFVLATWAHYVGDSSQRSEEIVKNLQLRHWMIIISIKLETASMALRVVDLGLNPAFPMFFFSPQSSQTTDLHIVTPVAVLPGAWWYRVRSETGWFGGSILRSGEIASLVCSFVIIIIMIALKGAISDFFAISSLRHKL